jgi:hypothetical protein
MFNCQSGYGFRDHVPEKDFDRHGMGAALVGYKELTVTGVHAVIECHMMVIIITLEGEFELVEEEAIPLLSIPFCFFSFSYHSVVHL